MRLASTLLAVVVSVGVVHAEPAKQTVTTTDPGAARRAAALWTFVGAAGLVTGSIALSLHERSEYHDAIARQDVPAANHAVLVTRYAGTGLFLAGGVAAGIALYLGITGQRMEKHTIIAPAVAPDSVGAVVSGSF